MWHQRQRNRKRSEYILLLCWVHIFSGGGGGVGRGGTCNLHLKGVRDASPKVRLKFQNENNLDLAQDLFNSRFFFVSSSAYFYIACFFLGCANALLNAICYFFSPRSSIPWEGLGFHKREHCINLSNQCVHTPFPWAVVTLKYKTAATELRTWKSSLISPLNTHALRVTIGKKQQQQAALSHPQSTLSSTSFPGFSRTRPLSLRRAGRREPWERGCPIITALGLSQFVPGFMTERYQTKEIALRLRVHHSFLLFYPWQPWSQVWILIIRN